MCARYFAGAEHFGEKESQECRVNDRQKERRRKKKKKKETKKRRQMVREGA